MSEDMPRIAGFLMSASEGVPSEHEQFPYGPDITGAHNPEDCRAHSIREQYLRDNPEHREKMEGGAGYFRQPGNHPYLPEYW